MRQVFARLKDKFSPKVLRSNDPQMPFVMRRKHWLLEETRFLLLTRRGPIELVIKPGYVAMAGFVGIVGAGVIAATTLFVGYNAVEAVSNDTISTAEASIPITEPADIEEAFIKLAAQERAAAGLSHPVDLLAETPDAEIKVSAGQRPTDSKASPANNGLPPEAAPAPADLTQFASLATPGRTAVPGGADPFGLRMNEDPATAGSSPDSVETRPTLGTDAPTATSALMAMLKSPLSSPFETSLAPWVRRDKGSAPAGQEPKTETVLPPSGAVTIAVKPPKTPNMIPFAPDSNMPVLNASVREQKLLRSMVREVRSIRASLTGLGIGETDLPPRRNWRGDAEAADFAALMMDLESHRSALRRVPLKPPMLYFYISSNYGNRKHPVSGKTRMHHGIDLAGTWQEDVHASAPGTVTFAGKMGSFGNVVRIQHDFNITTTYAHLSRITIRKGADVVPGTVIGKMGRTGRVDGAHLHYEIRVGRESMNPQKFFDIGHRIGVGGELLQFVAAE